MSVEQTDTYKTATWRLILHGATDGATNMAIDEAIVNAVVAGDSPPTLRFYAWAPPCLSLGRNQPLADADPVACQALGVDVVRRPTGGRAILHTDELTYSIALRQDDPRAKGDIVDSYRRLSKGLLAGLISLDVPAIQVTEQEKERGAPSPVCFERPSNYEITVGGRKLIGSAQWRARGGVLQHGSLPLIGDLGRIMDTLDLSDAERAAQRPRVHQRATTLEQAAGRQIPTTQVTRALIDGLVQALNLSLVPGDLTDREREETSRLRRDRYASSTWTEKA